MRRYSRSRMARTRGRPRGEGARTPIAGVASRLALPGDRGVRTATAAARAPEEREDADEHEREQAEEQRPPVADVGGRGLAGVEVAGDVDARAERVRELLQRRRSIAFARLDVR